MTIVWDTSVVIDVLRGHGAAVSYAASLTDIPVCSEISRVEVTRGIRTGDRAATDRLLGSLRWVALDEPIARRAGQLGRRWRQSHPGIATAGLVIAATADELEASLDTTNVRHFPMFSRLRPPYP